jgi:hypothetical protein
MVDGEHGWMILHSDPGGGMLPEILVTTADGGRTWEKPHDYSRPEGEMRVEMPIGENLPQLLIAESPTEAAFIAGRRFPDRLVATHTEDGGLIWAPPFTLFQGAVSELSGLVKERTHPERLCFDAEFESYDQKSGSTEIDHKRYCSLDGGTTWRPPVALPNPSVTIGDNGRGLGHGLTLPVYADATLGFTTVWGDHKSANWKDDGNPAGRESWREYRLYETTDGGKTWKQAPASVTNHYRAIDNIQIKQLESQGYSGWLLVTVPGDSLSSAFFYSADHGTNWKLFSGPATISRSN